MNENKRVLRITGSGNAQSSPDTIVITLTILGEDKNYQKAMTFADNSVMKLKSSLINAGFDEKSITTMDFKVKAVNKYVKKSMEEKYIFDKYEVRHALKIKFEYDTKKLARCVDVIVNSMAEPNFTIDFEVGDVEGMKDEALKNAVANAKSKAEVLSKSAGVTLGEILSIDHSFSEVNIYRPRTVRMAYDGGYNMLEKASASMESLNVEDIKIDANVTITWEIK